MLDISNIPNSGDNIKIFYTQGTTAWQTWTKPRNCNFIWMMCIGGGSGGYGGGAGGAPSSPGGASAAITRALIPAQVLPDTLYIQPGLGSAGAAGSTTSSNPIPGAANRSFISITPSSTTTLNLICTSGTAAATGATAETAATAAAAGLLSLGTFTSTGGQASTNASQVIPLTGLVVSAGGNGSNTAPAAAPDIVSLSLGLIQTPTIAGGASNGGRGSDGIWNWKPIYGLGGSGGGGASTGTAGNGGNGAYGCGGGGGGNAAAGGTGGTGGNGGDGLVIIAAF